MTRPPPARQFRRARTATAALFFTNGALFANLLPRYPEIKADLGLSNTQFGLAVAPGGSTAPPRVLETRALPALTPAVCQH